MLINFLKTSVTTLINSNNLTKLLLYIKKGCLAAAFLLAQRLIIYSLRTLLLQRQNAFL